MIEGRSTPIGAVRAARLMIGMRLQRLHNRYQGFRFSGPRQSGKAAPAKPAVAEEAPASPGGAPAGEGGDTRRAATAGKSQGNWLIPALLVLFMTFQAFNLSFLAMSRMQETLGTAAPSQSLDASGKPRPAPSRRVALPKAPGHGLPAGVLQGVTLTAALLLLGALFLSVGNGELARPDWDLEWLVTLPMSLRTLLAVRVAERALVSLGVILLWPFLAVVAWEAGHQTVPGLLLSLMATLPLLAVVGALRTVLDTGLRLSLSPAMLRNLQAAVGVVAIVLLLLATSVGLPRNYILQWAPAMPDWMYWLPPGLATTVAAGTQRASIGPALLLLLIETAVIIAAGIALTMRQLRFGVVAAGARESGRRPAPARQTPAVGGPRGGTGWSLLTPVQARELRLLSRDRNFLVQTLVLPVLLVGGQFLVNPSGGLIAEALASPTALAAIGFGIAAYALMFSAFQTLNTEGPALWILYSVPHPLESILWQKAVLWGVVCLVYPLVLCATGLYNGLPPLQVLGLGAVVLAGVPIFAVIATALGVFAADPLSPAAERRVRLSFGYLYMGVAGFYTYAIVASTLWQRATVVVLSALLALALWQKARDLLPYLLDPVESPPARVSVADGLIAAMLFFVLQIIGGLAWAGYEEQHLASTIAVGFIVAGAGTYGLMLYFFARWQATGVPRFLERSDGTLSAGEWWAATWGAGAGTVAALAALGYVQFVAPMLFQVSSQSGVPGPNDAFWIIVLTVAAAPVFEEFIFRGLIFGGLRRTLGLTASVLASAAIFAVVHPPAAVIPVFGLGVATALVYARTRLLIGPIATHAVYNAMVVGYQFFA